MGAVDTDATAGVEGQLHVGVTQLGEEEKAGQGEKGEEKGRLGWKSDIGWHFLIWEWNKQRSY